MDNEEIKQLLNVLSIMQQDMHDLKYEYLKIIIHDKTNLENQLKNIQTKLMLLEAFFKKQFGFDCINDLDIYKKYN